MLSGDGKDIDRLEERKRGMKRRGKWQRLTDRMKRGEKKRGRFAWR